MSETKSPLGGLTRRGFLKTTGAVTAVAAVAGTGAALAPMPANAEGSSSADGEQTFRSACRGNCGSRCPLEVTVREGKVVKARPMDMPGEDAVRKRFCVKGFSQPQRVYDTDRLKYPMKRVGERGAGEWERISWDEAVSTIAEKMGAAIKDYGGTSVAVRWQATCPLPTVASSRPLGARYWEPVPIRRSSMSSRRCWGFRATTSWMPPTPRPLSRGAAIRRKRTCMRGSSCAMRARRAQSSSPSTRSSPRRPCTPTSTFPSGRALTARSCWPWLIILSRTA